MAIARYDRQTGKMAMQRGLGGFPHKRLHQDAIADMGDNCYPSEPIFVPSNNNAEQGWLLTVVYHGNTDKSEVRIYESDKLTEAPVCRLALPSVIPPGFHGTWKQS